MHLGDAAGIRISSASNGLEMQNVLGKRSGNSNFEGQQRGLKCRMHLGNAAGIQKGFKLERAGGHVLNPAKHSVLAT